MDQYILRSIISPASCVFKKGCAKSTTRCLAAVMLRGAAAKSAFWWEKVQQVYIIIQVLKWKYELK